MKSFAFRCFLFVATVLLVSPIHSFGAIDGGAFANLKITKIAEFDYGDMITAMAADSENLWIGTSGGGIVKVDRKTLDFNTARDITTAEGLISNNISNIVTAFGKTYVATDKGLSIISGSIIENHESIKGVSLVNCMLATDGASVLIVGKNTSGGLLHYGGTKYTKLPFFTETFSKIAAIHMNSYRTFIMTDDAVLYKIFNSQLGYLGEWEKVIAPKTFFTSQFNTDFKIKRISTDNRRVLWIATESNLIRYDGREFKRSTIPELTNIPVSDLSVSDSGFKYVSTSKGVVVHINGRTKLLNSADGLTNDDITSIAASENGLFISSTAGIDLLTISSLEHDRIDCLSCHTQGENMGIHEKVDSQFPGIGAIKTNTVIKSGHKIHYNTLKNLFNMENNECLKCHGRMHPTRKATVINVDNGDAYERGYGNREFCLSCHDFAFADEVDPAMHQLRNMVPQNVATYYNINGHGARETLSAGKAILSDRDCAACHTHHGSRNAALITSAADYPITDDPELDATARDAFCKNRCHKAIKGNAIREVRDHTFERNRDEDRDHTGCPDQPCDTHPSNTKIPVEIEPRLWKYPSNILPLSEYDSFDGLNLGSIICTTCHDVHGSQPKDEVLADTQMIREEWTEFSTLCYECHK